MKAFIYSLDAFISLMIIAMALNMLVFGLGLSTYQYTVAYQLKLLSADGIRALASSPADLSGIVNNNNRVDACTQLIRKNLPPGYGYALLIYDKDSSNWYNMTGCSEGDYTKAGIGVQSSDAIVTVATVTEIPGGDTYLNPFGYKTCGGKNVPCNLQSYLPQWGLNATVMRLVVFV
jgi:hypothetical protein